MQTILVIGVIAGLIIAYFNVSGVIGGEEKGPLATGNKSAEVRNPQPVGGGNGNGFFRDFRSPPPPPARAPAPPPPAPPPVPSGTTTPPSASVSPHSGLIRIGRVERTGSPSTEIVRLNASGSAAAPVDVSGWRISSRRASLIVPRAYEIPEIDAAEQDIVLQPGGELVILTGTPAYQKNFRENSCTGYLNQHYRFHPGLSSSCPRGSPEDRTALLRRGFTGACIDFLERIPACRQPTLGLSESGLSADCTEYAVEHYSYVGCVANYRRSDGFLKNRWRAFAGSPTPIFDTRHDIVTLRDRQGLLVDEFVY